MLSDQKIWALLGDVNRTIDKDVIRLMFIELFSRLKALEEENLALRVLLIEEGLVNQELFNSFKEAVHDFLQMKGEQAARESDFFAKSGVSFPEWVNFKLNGQFSKPIEQ
ncbi:hypothetical protein LX24_01962 [Desulfallas thermosapovorans DSM 6562]|uniref:Uncharacterized protein n=2 Tax=Desulfallas thermosapovorans TaxID=58137 RepID=A0A5S4ZQQ3_9FIRM|nr:hypothetical protein LX24_01962 [Desulfallas thermosapovorans DSM 6562]